MPRQALARYLGRRAVVSATAAAFLVTLLFVVPAAFAAAANDNFANAKTLHLGKNVSGTITGATRQSGEPRHAQSLATHSVWYRLRVKRKMTVAVNTCQTSSDTVIAVYTGISLRGLKVVNYNNDGCNRSGAGSRVTFQARRGVTYRIAVAGSTDRGRFHVGAFRLSVPANDYFADAVEVTVGEGFSGNTVNATRELGEPRHQFNRSHTVWFELSVPTATLVEVTACNITAVTTYTGNSLRSLTRVTPTTSVHCGEQFEAQPGVIYHIVLESGGVGTGYRFSTRAVTPTP
jgi:hypothetical protein